MMEPKMIDLAKCRRRVVDHLKKLAREYRDLERLASQGRPLKDANGPLTASRLAAIAEGVEKACDHADDVFRLVGGMPKRQTSLDRTTSPRRSAGSSSTGRKAARVARIEVHHEA